MGLCRELTELKAGRSGPRSQLFDSRRLLALDATPPIALLCSCYTVEHNRKKNLRSVSEKVVAVGAVMGAGVK